MHRTLLIHDVTQALPGLDDSMLRGLRYYTERSLVCEGVAVLPMEEQAEMESYLAYLGELGIGASRIIGVAPDSQGSVYSALLADVHLQKQLRQLVEEDGFRLEFFNTRDGVEERLVEALGLDWQEHVLSHPSRVADIGNHKAEVRRIASSLGMPELFPPHEIVTGVQGLRGAFQRQSAEAGELVLKLPNLATGLSMLFTQSEDDLSLFVRDFMPEGIEEVIVEHSLGEHVSMTTVSRLVEGEVEDRWHSQQIMSRNGSGIAHHFSVVGDCPAIRPADVAWMDAAASALNKHFLVQQPKLSGQFNWDCARAYKGGARYVLEGNFRVGQSTYLRRIQSQIARARGVTTSEVTCFWGKVTLPASVWNFDSLQRKLGSTLLVQPQGCGVIPMATRAAKLGYCHLVAVGSNYRQARTAFEQAEQALAV